MSNKQYSLPVQTLFATLKSTPEGLSKQEAERRLDSFGPNRIPEKKDERLLSLFLGNFTHLMALLLWLASFIAFLVRSEALGVAIVLVNLINGCFGFWQETKAEMATESLRRLIPAFARVLRSGKEERISAEELVLGDLVFLSEGDFVSADGVLLEAVELRVDQSTLTGEAEPVKKSVGEVPEGTPLAERCNFLFAGTHVLAGSGRLLLTATGARTEFGRIASLTQTLKAPPSPLQLELERLAKTVSLLAVGMGIFFFAPAFLLLGVKPFESFIFALGMIIAFVPEGMPATVTLALAMGVKRMAGRKALVKRLSSIEPLGSTTVICTDKTGTLTENRMSLQEVWLDGAFRQPDERAHELLLACALCNNARVGENLSGSPTEVALLQAALRLGIESDRLSRLFEIPFDSERKRMSTVYQQGDVLAFVKGSPKELVALSSSILIEGKEEAFGEKAKGEVLEALDRAALQGYRILGVARKKLLVGSAFSAEEIEKDLLFLGLVSLLDPPREGVAEAIARCHRAGIRVIMLTGDYERTAEGIARRVGLLNGEKAVVLNGSEVEKLSDRELKGELAETEIFSRLLPEDKLRIVRLLQEMGQTVAVTGDGVNDAPALKKADIGVAMGATGTDVARSAADMILIDDHFASIVNAVEEGRAVYANIRRFASYIFACNMAEAWPAVLVLFSRGVIPLPLTMMQSLAIDLGSNMISAIGLGAEPAQAGAMDQPPRPRTERLLDRRTLTLSLLWYGMIESVLSLGAYFFLNGERGWPNIPLAPYGSSDYRLATTMTFAGIALAQVGNAFANRTDRLSVFSIGLSSNRLILWGVLFSGVFLFLMTELSFLQSPFGTSPLGTKEWGLLLTFPLILLSMDEGRKLVLRMRGGRSGKSAL